MIYHNIAHLADAAEKIYTPPTPPKMKEKEIENSVSRYLTEKQWTQVVTSLSKYRDNYVRSTSEDISLKEIIIALSINPLSLKKEQKTIEISNFQQEYPQYPLPKWNKGAKYFNTGVSSWHKIFTVDEIRVLFDINNFHYKEEFTAAEAYEFIRTIKKSSVKWGSYLEFQFHPSPKKEPVWFLHGFNWGDVLNNKEVKEIMMTSGLNYAQKTRFSAEEVYKIVCILKNESHKENKGIV